MESNKEIFCPVCGKKIFSKSESEDTGSSLFPFCSNRCKLIDLGKWLDSEYRIDGGQVQSDPFNKNM